jgi:hypothetical protein
MFKPVKTEAWSDYLHCLSILKGS